MVVRATVSYVSQEQCNMLACLAFMSAVPSLFPTVMPVPPLISLRSATRATMSSALGGAFSSWNVRSLQHDSEHQIERRAVAICTFRGVHEEMDLAENIQASKLHLQVLGLLQNLHGEQSGMASKATKQLVKQDNELDGCNWPHLSN
jgi:hypothetical protein